MNGLFGWTLGILFAVSVIVYGTDAGAGVGLIFQASQLFGSQIGSFAVVTIASVILMIANIKQYCAWKKVGGEMTASQLKCYGYTYLFCAILQGVGFIWFQPVCLFNWGGTCIGASLGWSWGPGVLCGAVLNTFFAFVNALMSAKKYAGGPVVAASSASSSSAA